MDNVTTIPMTFPITTAGTWNTNTYNTLPKEMFRYEHDGRPKKVDAFTFPNTIQVSGRTNTYNVISYNLGYTIYALGIGLVFEEQTDYEYCQENGEICPGDPVITSGTSTIRQLIAYPEVL